MKIYTRTGDQGTTGLFGDDRIAKNHIRIEAYGTVDETNAILGVVRAAMEAQDVLNPLDLVLLRLQNELFVLGADLATPNETTYPIPRIEAQHTTAIEHDIDTFEADLPPLKQFILPGGTPVAAALHQARTVCRRAERLVVKAATTERINSEAIPYLNRLSDLLFVLARWANQQLGIEAPEWIPINR